MKEFGRTLPHDDRATTAFSCSEGSTITCLKLPSGSNWVPHSSVWFQYLNNHEFKWLTPLCNYQQQYRRDGNGGKPTCCCLELGIKVCAHCFPRR